MRVNKRMAKKKKKRERDRNILSGSKKQFVDLDIKKIISLLILQKNLF